MGCFKKKKSSCAMLLTTHSMEEAEILCDRLGIFVNGKLVTIGSPSDLKAKFGRGYKLTLTTEDQYVEKIEKFIKKNIKGVKLISLPIAGNLFFSVPKKSITIARLFSLLEENKEEINLIDWGISNSTLEEIFLHIVDKEDLKKKNEIEEEKGGSSV